MINRSCKERDTGFFQPVRGCAKSAVRGGAGVRSCRITLRSLSVPKEPDQPLVGPFLCPIFTNRKQWNHYTNGDRLCQPAPDATKNPPCGAEKEKRFGKQNRTGIRRTNIRESTSHELSASTRREMTLDYSFLSDSRNFFMQSRVISVHSYYLTSMVTSEFYSL